MEAAVGAVLHDDARASVAPPPRARAARRRPARVVARRDTHNAANDFGKWAEIGNNNQPAFLLFKS